MNEQTAKEPSLTDSVARLYRAGSATSEGNRKLREAIDQLLRWMINNLPDDLIFPKILPDRWVFHKECCRLCQVNVDFLPLGHSPDSLLRSPRHILVLRGPNSQEAVLAFAQTIADGWLDGVTNLLEARATVYHDAANALNQFLTGTEQ